jgi:hypothetical protein
VAPAALPAGTVERRLHRRHQALAPCLRIPRRLFPGPRLPGPAARHHHCQAPSASTADTPQGDGLDHDPPREPGGQ